MTSSKSSKTVFRKGTDLAVHPFGIQVLKNIRPPRKTLDVYRVIARMALEPLFDDLPDPNEYTSFGEDTMEEKYHLNIASYFRGLMNTINRLEAIQTYLALTISLPESFIRKEISEEEWILYHYSNYILSVVGIYDIALYLVSSVAQFDIAPNPRYESFLRNKIKDDDRYSGLKQPLDNLKSKIGQYKDQRNLYIHKGQKPHYEELDRINLADIYNLFRKSFDLDHESDSRKQMAYWLAANRLKKEIEDETDVICSLLEDLFSFLMPIYICNVDAIRTNS